MLPERKPFGVSLINSKNVNIGFLQRIDHIDVAKVAWIERELNSRSRSHSPPQFAEFEAVVLQPLQFDAIVKHYPLSRHPEHDVQLAGTRWQWRWQAVHFGMPSMRGGILDAAMGRL